MRKCDGDDCDVLVGIEMKVTQLGSESTKHRSQCLRQPVATLGPRPVSTCVEGCGDGNSRMSICARSLAQIRLL